MIERYAKGGQGGAEDEPHFEGIGYRYRVPLRHCKFIAETESFLDETGAYRMASAIEDIQQIRWNPNSWLTEEDVLACINFTGDEVAAIELRNSLEVAASNRFYAWSMTA